VTLAGAGNCVGLFAEYFRNKMRFGGSKCPDQQEYGDAEVASFG
jgi:hypothetical protein